MSVGPRHGKSNSSRTRPDLHASTGRGGIRQTYVLGSTAPGTSARPGTGVFLHGGATLCTVGVLLMSGGADPLHRIQVIEITPEFLEAVRGGQSVGVVAEVVLAELAGIVTEVEQELGERGSAGPQVGSGCPAVAAGSFRCAKDACQ